MTIFLEVNYICYTTSRLPKLRLDNAYHVSVVRLGFSTCYLLILCQKTLWIYCNILARKSIGCVH